MNDNTINKRFTSFKAFLSYLETNDLALFKKEIHDFKAPTYSCLLYTSDAADERSSVDLGGRRIIKKKKKIQKKKNKVRAITSN